MWMKGKIKKGFSLLDVMIALSILSVAILCAFSIHLLKISQEKINQRQEQHINCIEIAGKSLIAKNRHVILKNLSSEPHWYIKEEHLDFDILAMSNIVGLMSNTLPNGNSYLKISITGDDILVIRLELHYKIIGGDEKIQYEVYKGHYN